MQFLPQNALLEKLFMFAMVTMTEAKFVSDQLLSWPLHGLFL